MKSRSLQFTISTAAAILFCSFILFGNGTTENPPADEHARDKVLIKTLMSSLQNAHFAPINIDDDFSKKAFGLYIERLDYSKRFLLKQDIEAMKMYETKIDDQVNEAQFTLFDMSWEILQSRLKETQGYYREILSDPFDYSIKEDIEIDQDKREFSESHEELKEHWRKILKYQCLTRIAEMQEQQEKRREKSDTVELKDFAALEVSAREKVLKSNDRFYERMTKWDRQDQMEVYINSMVNVFGPHTGYFAPKDKENFDISMSGQLEGIGAQLQEKDGYIKVTNIVPGSASYRQGELEEEDLILKVAQATGDPVDVTDMRLDEAVKLIRGKKGTEVRLTIKKISGVIKEITIVRDVVILEETYAKSAIIQNETGTRVGYINLPKFYADFNQSGGRAAADDVKKELLKLKAENVEGIILDLRGNGGGSLRDAIEMTGHFIPDGPVVQVKGRYSKPEVMSDRESGVIYDGPLVVMMNHFSASASEILAAAIQDYDRGIIMGSTQSFGKGTVQRFFDLDRGLTGAESQYRPIGSVKITTQKFYRVNGGATQLRGVASDISMPDRFKYLDMGESEQQFVMPWSEIPAASYKIWKPSYNEAAVIKSSQERIAQNEVMTKVEANSKRLKARSEETIVSLNYDMFMERKRELDKEDEAFEDLMQPIVSLSVLNISTDMTEISADSVKVELNEKWLKKLNKDAFLNEAVYVISDMKKGV